MKALNLKRPVRIWGLCPFAALLLAVPASAAAAPAITGISPNQGPASGGTMVTVTGSGFASGATAKFGETASPYVVYISPTSILARSPAGTGGSTVEIKVTTGAGTSAATPSDQFAYDSAPTSSWLGLNTNSGVVGPGHFAFYEHNIVYDRSYQLEATAGEGVIGTALGEGLERSVSHGMKPIVTVGYWASGLPSGTAAAEYKAKFYTTVKAVRKAYPETEILFEVINEPWFQEEWTTAGTAKRYGELVAAVLGSAEKEGIPTSIIYVGAFGEKHGEQWIPTMYETNKSLKTLIKAWYFHPYGRPGLGTNGNSLNEGIMSVPKVQSEMNSGQNNIIISEIGFWTPDVREGGHEPSDEYQRAASSAEAAELLTETLDEGRAMHQEGWLKALVVYSRTDGGWAMVNNDGSLTAQGNALVNFGDYVAKPPVFSLEAGAFGSGAGQFGKPLAVATDESGNVWVTDPGHSRIEEFSSLGVYKAEIPLSVGSTAVAVSPTNGHIYVIQSSAQIADYEPPSAEYPSGHLVRTFGGTSTLTYPEELAVDSEGNIWVVDSGKNQIVAFRPSGSVLRTIESTVPPKPLVSPRAIAVGGKVLYVANAGSYGEARIDKFSTEGNFLGEIGPAAWSYLPYTEAVGLAINSVSGDLYASTKQKVSVFSPEGSFLTSFGSTGSGEGQWANPRGLAFDSAQDLWISDPSHSRIEKWAPSP